MWTSSTDSDGLPIERMLLARPDADGVVLADPRDPAYEIAIRHSHRHGRALRQWTLGEPPPPLSPQGGSVTLVASWSLLEHSTVESLRRHLGPAADRRPWGVLTGATLSMIGNLADRLVPVPTEIRRPGWVLASRQIIDRIACPARTLIAEALTLTSLREATHKGAHFGVIAGHGREDVCYFANFAICGQSTCLKSRPCAKDHCPYLLDKIYADEIAARITCLLSCSAGRIGAGTLPSSCRLALSMLLGGAAACLAPTSLFSLSTGLIEYVVQLLLDGKPVGEIARLAAVWYEKATGDQDPFVVFGDPEVTSAERLATGTGTLHWRLADEQECLAVDQIASQLHDTVSGLERIQALGYLSEDGEALKTILARQDHQFAELIQLARSSDQLRAELGKLWSRIAPLRDEVELSIVRDMALRAQTEYMWLAGSYRAYSLHKGNDTTCSRCGSQARQDSFLHPFRSGLGRRRINCTLCGIVEDHGAGGVCLVNALWQKEFSQIALDVEADSAPRYGALAVTINKGDGVFVRSTLLGQDHGEMQVRLPARARLSKRTRIQIDLHKPRSGVYYVKLFWIERLELTECSAPVAISVPDSQVYP